MARARLPLDLTAESGGCSGSRFHAAHAGIAQERVGADTRLIEADVTSMDLEDTFDAAISRGGVCFVIDAEDEFLLGTHLSHRDQEVEGLKNVSAHLESDGLLLLSVQEMHHDFNLTLPEGVVYSQRISVTEETEELDDHFMIEKQYSFTQDSEVIGEETFESWFLSAKRDGRDPRRSRLRVRTHRRRQAVLRVLEPQREHCGEHLSQSRRRSPSASTPSALAIDSTGVVLYFP